MPQPYIIYIGEEGVILNNPRLPYKQLNRLRL